jgi:hypothetical protein
VSEKEFPGHVVKTLAGLAARGARLVNWYELYDSYNRGKEVSRLNSESFFGLAYPDYSRKAAFAAFALCSRYIAGMDYRPDLLSREGLPASTTALFFHGANGENTLILWENRKRTVQLALPGTGHQLHNITSGGSQPLPETTELSLDSAPRIITWTDGEAFQPPIIRSRPTA